MKELENIKDDIQNIAEAILSVLNIDVTIVDDDFIRIAGTGQYINQIGDKLDGYSAFKRAFIEQVGIFIEDPRDSHICNGCDQIGSCTEFAEVCCPIVLDGKSYGVIGLIAFNKKQSSMMKNSIDDLMNFLKRMADLISSKLKAQMNTEELELEKKKLEILLNSMDKAVVSVDIDGYVDKCNQKFQELFNFKEEEIYGESIFDTLDFIKKTNSDNFSKYKMGTFVYNKKHRNVKGIYNINKIILKGNFKGYVIDFIEKREAIKNYNKINKDYKITLENITGCSELINQTKKNALIASNSTSTVLITGESGTGKELFARSIHNHSNRADNPFVTVNCAAIPDNLLESELFGYEEGAFTGAKKGGKLGKFELADKGSIFLDEIGDMSLHLQAKLLRVLQERELDKIGGKSNIFIDVRIIAATNKDLSKMVKSGAFREDLYYRLNVIPIKLPSLRERKEDIPLMIDYMIKEYSDKLGKKVLGIEENAKQLLINYNWPGNVRELQNVIEYSINMSTTEMLTIDSMPKTLTMISETKESNYEKNGIITLEELEIREIKKALDLYKDYKKDKELAAKALGISRATLYRKLEKYKDYF